MKNSIKIFSYKGTPVYLKYWIVLLPLFFSIFESLAIVISVLVHELAHTHKAHKLGYKTEYVFVNLLVGGALVDQKHLENYKHSIKIAFAGPLSNIKLALLSAIISIPLLLYTDFGEKLFHFFFYFSFINLLIAFFNLLPIFPLDGGRISKGIFNLYINDKDKSRKLSSILSLITSLILIYVSLIYSLWILLIVFIILFIISILDYKNRI